MQYRRENCQVNFQPTTTIGLILFCSLAWTSPVRADDLIYFRRDFGVAPEGAALPDNFESSRLLWKTDLAPGNSTPCVCGDSVYVTTWREAEQELATVALDVESGAIRWNKVAPAKKIEPFHRVGSPASASVACDRERIFSFFGSCGLLCYSLDGELRWHKEMGPFQDEFGASSSPVLVDNLVVLNEDHDVDSYLIGIDRLTGDKVWQTPRPQATRSYSSPVVFRSGNVTELVVAGSLQLSGYDARTGARRWWLNGLSRIVDCTPSVHDGYLYLASWTPGGDETDRIAMEPFAEFLANRDANKNGTIARNELPAESPVLERFFRIDTDQNGELDEPEWNRHRQVFDMAQNVALAVQLGSEGDLTESRIRWIARRGLPTVPSSVVYRGVMHMVKDSGIVTSLDIHTGEILKQQRAPGRGNYYASLIAGDGKVYLCSEQGVVTILQADRDFKVLTSHDFQQRIMATPVAAQGRFFLRTDEALYCFTP